MLTQRIVSVSAVVLSVALSGAAGGCASDADSDATVDADLYDDSGLALDDGKADAASQVCKWTNDGKVFNVTYKRFAVEAAGRCYLGGAIGMIFGPETAAFGCVIGVGQAATSALGKLAVNKVMSLACESGYVRGKKAATPPRCEDVPRGGRPQPCI
jgi:hypothetical protein